MKRKNTRALMLGSLLLSSLTLAACTGNAGGNSQSSSTGTSSTQVSSSPVTSSPVSSESDSSSSSLPEEEGYSLTAVAEHAAITFTVDGKSVTRAETGQRVYVDVEVDEGYTLSDLTATGATLTKIAGRYSLVVEESDIVVTATVEKIASYAINLDLAEGVHASITVDGSAVTEASEGQEVVVNLSFDSKYSFVSIQVEGASYTILKEGSSYQFTMPEKAVTVKVLSQYHPENFAIDNIINLDPSRISDVQGIDYRQVETERDTVSFTFQGTQGATFGAAYILGDTVGEISLTEGEGGLYTATFTMPEGNPTIVLYTRTQASASGKTLRVEGDHFFLFGLENGATYSQDSLTAYIIPEDGYSITGVTSRLDGAGEGSALSLEGNAVSFSTAEAAGSATLEISTEYVGSASIEVSDFTDLIIEGDITDLAVGSEVELPLSAEVGSEIQEVALTGAEGEEIPFTYEGGILSFTMPEGGVKLEVAVGIITPDLRYEQTPGISDVYFTYDEVIDPSQTHLTEANVGDLVLVHFTVDTENYRLDQVLCNGEKIELFDVNYPEKGYKFKVETTDDLTITWNLTSRYSVTIPESEEYEIASGVSSKPAVGEKVTFQLKEVPGFRIDSVTSSATTIADEGKGIYSFTMPAGEVKIDVATSECDTTTLKVAGEGYENLQILDRYGDQVAPDSLVNVGDTFTASADPANGFDLEGMSLNEEALSAQDGTYTFTVAEGATNTLSIQSVEQSKHEIAISGENTDHYTYTIADNGHAVDDLYGYVGHTIQVAITVDDPLYTFFRGAKVTAADGTEIEAQVDTEAGTITFVMPDQAVTITPEIEAQSTVEDAVLTIVDNGPVASDGGSCIYVAKSESGAYGNPSDLYASGDVIEPGATIYLAKSMYAGYGYSDLIVTVTNDTTGETIFEYTFTQYTYGYQTFTAPNSSITITINTASE